VPPFGLILSSLAERVELEVGSNPIANAGKIDSMIFL
jgi:hypothetical protein